LICIRPAAAARRLKARTNGRWPCAPVPRLTITPRGRPRSRGSERLANRRFAHRFGTRIANFGRLCENCKFDPDRAAEFESVDTALHVAADPSPEAGWRGSSHATSICCRTSWQQPSNTASGCGLRSSNFDVAGNRFGRSALTTTLEPVPINPSGASKLFGERVSKMFAER
jgi:hypothetical protein